MAYPRFNPADKDPDIGLSNGDRAITLLVEDAGGGIRANVPLSATEKIYCEYVVVEAESDGRFGLATAAYNLASSLGYDEYGWGFSNRWDRAYHDNVQTLDGGNPNTTDGTVIRLAWNPLLGNLWFGREAAWLGTGADPATDTNPAYSGLPSTGLYLAAFLSQASGFAAAAGTLRTDPATFTQAVPSGFAAPSYTAPTVNGNLSDCYIPHRLAALPAAAIDLTKPTRGGAQLVLPAATMAAHGGGQTRLVLPSAALQARGQVGVNARAQLVLPLAMVTAAGWQPITAHAALTAPTAWLQAHGFVGIGGQTHLTLPPALAQAGGYVAAIGGAHLVLPLPACSAQGTVRGRFEDFTLKHRRF